MLKVVSKEYSLPARWNFRPPAGIRLVDVRTLEELDQHGAAWNSLLHQAARLSPILSYAWMRAFFKNQVRGPEQWLCLFAYENDHLIGILPLVSSYAIKVFGFSLHLFKLPYHVAHTGGTDCLTLPGRENVVGLFLDYLNRIPRTLPVLSLKHVPEHYPSVTYFARKKHKMCAAKVPGGFETFIPLPKSSDEYFTGLSQNARKNLNRRSRELEKIPDVRFLFRESLRSVHENTIRFLDIESCGWKGKEKTAVRNFTGSAELFENAAEELAKQNLMAFSFLETGEKTMAAHYAMVNNRTLYILKMAYDEAYEECAPGNLLMLKVIGAACDSGTFDEVNFVAAPPSAARWNVQKRALVHLIVLPKIPLLSHLLIWAIQSQKFHKFDTSR